MYDLLLRDARIVDGAGNPWQRGDLAITGPENRRGMKALLAGGMQQGALGFSTESGSHRGMDFDLAELVELCQVAARYGGSYACHMRSYDDRLIASLEEAFYTAEAARIPLILSHLMVNGLENAGKSNLVLDLIDQARDRGLQVAVDIFPYWFEEALHFSPLLSSVLPEWAVEGGPEALRARVKDPPQRARLLDELQAGKSSRAYVVPGRTEQEAYGLSLVIVNGQVVLEGDALTGARPGKILRRPARRS